MAEIVGRKLVENGQERILHRIYDGLTSNFVLDVADSKQSQEHQLIHLVWRRSPRNQKNCATDGQKTTISDSTQTNELTTLDHSQFSEKPSTSNMNWIQTRDMRGTFDANNSALITDSFKTPAKWQSSKPRTLETTKYQTEISNRFDCLKHDIPAQNAILFKRGRQSSPPHRIFYGKKRHSHLPTETLLSSKKHSSGSLKSEIEFKTTPEKNLSKISTPFGSDGRDLRPLLPTVSGPPVPSCPPRYKIGTVKTCVFESIRLRCRGHPTYMGCINTVDQENILYACNQFLNEGSQVTFELEYISGEQRATHIAPYHDAFSPGHLSVSDSDF